MKSDNKMKTVKTVIVVLVAAGIVFSIIGVAMGASRTLFWTKNGISVASGIESVINEPDLGYFDGVDIDVGYGDVEFINSDKYGVEAYSYNQEWNWSLVNGTLKISYKKNTVIQIMNLDWNLDDANYVKVYLPAGAKLGDVKVKSGSGNISVGDFQADNLQIYSSFGNVDLYSVKGGDMLMDLDSGNFTGKNLDANDFTIENNFGKGRFQSVNAVKFSAHSDSGEITMTDCSFGDMTAVSNFGAITADALKTGKININSDSGHIKMEGEFLGETVITSDFGNVGLTTSIDKTKYTYDLSTDFGSVTLDGEKLANGAAVISMDKSANSFKIKASSGNIDIGFK